MIPDVESVDSSNRGRVAPARRCTHRRVDQSREGQGYIPGAWTNQLLSYLHGAVAEGVDLPTDARHCPQLLLEEAVTKSGLVDH
eukprot:9496805-Pyramimonas_sp.AAC.1